MAIYELFYDENLVCAECGKQEYHINLSFHMPKAKIYYDHDVVAWCHNCSEEATLAEEVDYDL